MQSIGNRHGAAQHSNHELLCGWTACATTTPTMMAITARTTRVMMKHIHRFLRAARAESTALTTSLALRETIIMTQCVGQEIIMTYARSVCFRASSASNAIFLTVWSCSST